MSQHREVQLVSEALEQVYDQRDEHVAEIESLRTAVAALQSENATLKRELHKASHTRDIFMRAYTGLDAELEAVQAMVTSIFTKARDRASLELYTKQGEQPAEVRQEPERPAPRRVVDDRFAPRRLNGGERLPRGDGPAVPRFLRDGQPQEAAG